MNVMVVAEINKVVREQNNEDNNTLDEIEVNRNDLPVDAESIDSDSANGIKEN